MILTALAVFFAGRSLRRRRQRQTYARAPGVH
jgi:hypothetical protein